MEPIGWELLMVTWHHENLYIIVYIYLFFLIIIYINFYDIYETCVDKKNNWIGSLYAQWRIGLNQRIIKIVENIIRI